MVTVAKGAPSTMDTSCFVMTAPRSAPSTRVLVTTSLCIEPSIVVCVSIRTPLIVSRRARWASISAARRALSRAFAACIPGGAVP